MKVFIVSTGRTGTSFLGHTLDDFEGIHSVHEPNPEMGKEGSRYLRWKNRALHHATIRHYLPMGFFYRKKFEWSRKSMMGDEDVFIESNSELSGILDLVKQTFPDALIVQILRDPVEFVRSALSKGFFFDRDKNLKKRRIFMDAWEMEDETWHTMPAVKRASDYYVALNKRLEDHEPDLTLFFDRIFSSPYEDFRTFVDRLELESLEDVNYDELFGEKKNTSSDYILPDYEDWKSDWKNWIQPARDYYRTRKDEVVG